MMAEPSGKPSHAKAVRRVASWPVDRLNPYHARYYEALSKRGYLCDPSTPRPGWRLADKVAEEEILHLHWGVEEFYRSRNAVRSARLLARFISDLVALRLAGKKIVWTCHNVLPHERHWADRPAHFALAHLAHVIFVHADCVKHSVKRLYQRSDDVYVITMGSCDAHSGPFPPAGEARKLLGLPNDAFVYLFMGHVREYKGIKDLISAFKKEAGPKDYLLILGRPADHGAAHLLDQAVKDKRIRVLNSATEEEWRAALGAGNCLVLPFRRITTSSSCFQGPVANIPVILPALDYFVETFGADYPLLFKPRSVNDLRKAMRRAREMAPASLRRWYEPVKERLSWDFAAKQTARVLNTLFANGHGGRKED